MNNFRHENITKVGKEPFVWIDFENAPHVWVMSPIISFLKKKGIPLLLTARDFSYTTELCSHLGIEVEVIGVRGFGKSDLSKIARIFIRAIQLLIAVRRKPKAIALSHGSRSQIIAARLLRVPVICLDDYEYSNQSLARFIDYLLVPFPISRSIWGENSNRVINYPGLKEEIYLSKFKAGLNAMRGFNDSYNIKILFRPEGRFTHYRSALSAELQIAILKYIATINENILLIILPRDDMQKKELIDLCRELSLTYWIPDRILDGPSLISEMDLVLSGGGTMTREAAVIGIPSYSFFGGEWGAVDQYLKRQGRIYRISTLEDVNSIAIKKKEVAEIKISSKALAFIVDFIERRYEKER